MNTIKQTLLYSSLLLIIIWANASGLVLVNQSGQDMTISGFFIDQLPVKILQRLDNNKSLILNAKTLNIKVPEGEDLKVIKQASLFGNYVGGEKFEFQCQGSGYVMLLRDNQCTLSSGLPAGIYVAPNGDHVQIFPAPTSTTPLGTMADWNQRVDNTNWTVSANSQDIINTIGATTRLHPDFGNTVGYGIPFNVVTTDLSSTNSYKVTFTTYGDESSPGPYIIPPGAKIENGGLGDAHLLVLDAYNNKLYELYHAKYDQKAKTATAASGVIWDLNSSSLWGPDYPNTKPPQGSGWTSADAAGLPVFPGILRYNNFNPPSGVPAGLNHALRFTAPKTRQKFLPPAVHQAGSTSSSAYPPMGMRVRLKSNAELAEIKNKKVCGINPEDIPNYPEKTQLLIQGLQQYGMILADNGGAWYVSGEQNDNWPSGSEIWNWFNPNNIILGGCFEVICPKTNPNCTS